MPSEFNLIQQYFTRPSPQADLGVGDDAALVRVSKGNQLVISTDMSVAGTHFLHDCAPYNIGWKALAVNVSDMAAMGAQPKWATLAIALPEVNKPWLAEFSRGFFACADAFNIDLIGGDTTRGPLNICVQIMGEVPTGKALRRDGAKLNDEIWVSGSLGMAAYALAVLQSKDSDFEHIGYVELENLRAFLEKPLPPMINFEDAEMSPMGREFYNANRRVSNGRIKEELGVELIYPTYREGLESISSSIIL